MGGSTTKEADPQARELLERLTSELGSIIEELRDLEEDMRFDSADGRAATWMLNRAAEVEQDDPDTAAQLRSRAQELIDGLFAN